MAILLPLLLLVVGIVVLMRGADDLVEGASALALRFGVSPLLVGLTIVAFGTSAPELVTSLLGSVRAMRGEAGAASVVLGNMIGSCSCNVGLVLGASGLAAPMAVSALLRRRDVPRLAGMVAVLAAVAWTIGLGPVAGVVLLAAFAASMTLLFRSELRGRRAERRADEAAREEEAPRPATRSALRVAAGLAFLILGAWLLVEGAVRLARQAGISEAVIGLTIVSLGTSMPEFATSLSAARRGNAEIALGNVVGANIFNVGGGIGIAALIAPLQVDPVLLHRDLLVMIGFTIALVLLSRRPVIGRAPAAMLLVAYLAYLAWCAMHA